MKAPTMHRRRHMVADRDGWNCRYCAQLTECKTCYPSAHLEATLDHVIARSKGGRNALFNLVIACRPCNNNKGDQEDWLPPIPVTKQRRRLTWRLGDYLYGVAA